MADPSNKVAFPDPSDRMPTILVVEDELLVRLNLSDYLQECGFKVLEARDADEAIVMIEEGGVEIDLVFSTLRCPGRLMDLALQNGSGRTVQASPSSSHPATKKG